MYFVIYLLKCILQLKTILKSSKFFQTILYYFIYYSKLVYTTCLLQNCSYE